MPTKNCLWRNNKQRRTSGTMPYDWTMNDSQRNTAPWRRRWQVAWLRGTCLFRRLMLLLTCSTISFRNKTKSVESELLNFRNSSFNIFNTIFLLKKNFRLTCSAISFGQLTKSAESELSNCRNNSFDIFSNLFDMLVNFFSTTGA